MWQRSATGSNSFPAASGKPRLRSRTDVGDAAVPRCHAISPDRERVRGLLDLHAVTGVFNLVRELLAILGKPESLIRHVTDRPGHDRRYALDAGKARRELHRRPQTDFARDFAHTVRQLAVELA